MELCTTKAGTQASLGLHSAPFEAPPKLGCGLAQPEELPGSPRLFPAYLSQFPFQETQDYNIYWLLWKIQLNYFTNECTSERRYILPKTSQPEYEKGMEAQVFPLDKWFNIWELGSGFSECELNPSLAPEFPWKDAKEPT